MIYQQEHNQHADRYHVTNSMLLMMLKVRFPHTHSFGQSTIPTSSSVHSGSLRSSSCMVGQYWGRGKLVPELEMKVDACSLLMSWRMGSCGKLASRWDSSLSGVLMLQKAWSGLNRGGWKGASAGGKNEVHCAVRW